MTSKEELLQHESDLEEVIKGKIAELDSIARQNTKDGMVRVLLAISAYPEVPKYALQTDSELATYSIGQELQEAHFRLFAVKGAIHQMEDDNVEEKEEK